MSAAPAADRKRFAAALARRFVLRGHMALMLVAVAFGHVTQRLCPDAHSVVQAFLLCVVSHERP
jgi:hypothetical protein